MSVKREAFKARKMKAWRDNNFEWNRMTQDVCVCSCCYQRNQRRGSTRNTLSILLLTKGKDTEKKDKSKSSWSSKTEWKVGAHFQSSDSLRAIDTQSNREKERERCMLFQRKPVLALLSTLQVYRPPRLPVSWIRFVGLKVKRVQSFCLLFMLL